MSANTIEAWVSILWCRNWLPVSKIIWKRGSWCEVVEYSDWLDETLWTEWECGAGAPSTRFDREVLCDPTTGDRIHVRMEYLTDGTINPTTAFMLDGVTPYAGAINALVSCSGKEQFDYESSIVYDNCVAVVQTIVHDADDTGAVATIIYTNLDGTAHAFVGPLTAEPCDAITERIEQNLMPVDAVGNPVWTVVKEIRTYTNGVVATAYQDTVTGAVVALPAGTVQLVEEMVLQKEPMYMCDWGATTFIRHFVYNFGIRALLSFDTELDGTTPYIPAWVVTWWECKWNIPSSPQYYMWDNWAFIWTAIYDNNWSLVNISTVNWNSPSSINSIAYSEYWYSVTANAVSWTTLDEFLTNNTPDFINNRVISISIMNDDDTNNFEYRIRNASSSTILNAWVSRSISWWGWNWIAINNKFFWDFYILSDALITVSWEQLEI